MTWANFLENNHTKRIVKKDDIGDMHISTIFIGLDHGFSLLDEKEMDDYKPLIFETMVFKNNGGIYCDRYSTWKEAEEGHQKAIDWVNNGCIDCVRIDI